MEELSGLVNESVLLAQQNGLYVQYIQVVEAHNGYRPHPPIGTRRPLTRTASGRVLLSLMSDAQILRILRRLNSQEERPENRVDERELLSAITQMRQTGFTVTENTMTRGVGSVGTFAPQLPGQPPLALAVTAPIERLRKNREAIIAAMKRMLPQNMAPRAPREVSFGATTLYTPATAVPIMPRRITFGTEIS
jgi:DNA-binding IclR family transcriptional regulator